MFHLLIRLFTLFYANIKRNRLRTWALLRIFYSSSSSELILSHDLINCTQSESWCWVINPKQYLFPIQSSEKIGKATLLQIRECVSKFDLSSSGVSSICNLTHRITDSFLFNIVTDTSYTLLEIPQSPHYPTICFQSCVLSRVPCWRLTFCNIILFTN
jgi:hypothetical protein